MFVVNFRSINAWMKFVAYGWRKVHRGCSKIAVFWITLYKPQLQHLLLTVVVFVRDHFNGLRTSRKSLAS
ncbi:unnamed protein product [Prunus armeniaca]